MSPDHSRRHAIPYPPDPEPPEGVRPHAGGGGGGGSGRGAFAWVVLDATGAILRVSDAWAGLLRAHRAEVPRSGVGLDYAGVLRTVFPDLPAAFAGGVHRVLVSAVPIFEQELGWSEAGERRGMRVVVTPSVGGRGEGAVVTHIDVTAEARERRDARRAQDLQQAVAAAGRGLARPASVAERLDLACRALVEVGGARIARAEWVAADGAPVAAVRGEDDACTDALARHVAAPLATRPGPDGDAYREGRANCRGLPADWDEWHREHAAPLELGCVLATPLARAGRPAGAVTVYWRDPEPPGACARLVLESLAGALSLALAATEDAVRLAESERSLRDHAGRLDRLERIARVGRWEIALPGRHWTGSGETHRILGAEPGALAGTYDAFLDVVHPEDRAAVRAAHERALEGAAELDVEHRIIRADGEVRHVRERAVLEPCRLLGTLQDVTDHHRIERQLLRAERLETIATLANGVGHDLNNVLSPILLSLELLRSGNLETATGAETLALIEASAHRGAEVVRQLLSFAPGAEGRHVDVQLKHLLRDVEKVARNTFPKQIGVQVHLPVRLWPVTGDPAQIRQVVLSLCLNARDAMPGGGTLTISAENLVLDEHYRASVGEGVPGPHVCVRVEDTGHGVPAGMLDRIFDPFFTTRGRGATGLGLSTALAVVRRHGGFIRVQSDPGAGAVFRVYLPAAAGAVPSLAHGEPALPRGRGECVLVVDDEASVREVTKRTLERHGYRPILASDGAEALVLFTQRRHEIAVVLTDLMMPLVDGRALMAALRRADPRVRIVAMSGTRHGELPPGAAEGALQFLDKPFTSAALLTALRAALDSGGRED